MIRFSLFIFGREITEARLCSLTASSQMRGILICAATGNVHFDAEVKEVCVRLLCSSLTHRHSGGGNLKLCKYPIPHQTSDVFIY